MLKCCAFFILLSRVQPENKLTSKGDFEGGVAAHTHEDFCSRKAGPSAFRILSPSPNLNPIVTDKHTSSLLSAAERHIANVVLNHAGRSCPSVADLTGLPYVSGFRY